MERVRIVMRARRVLRRREGRWVVVVVVIEVVVGL